MAQYFKFKFVSIDRSGWNYSDWMDERISQSVTIERRTYLSCNTLGLALRPLDRWFVLSKSESKHRMHLWREGAPVRDDPNQPMSWRVISDLGEPDRVVTATSVRDPNSHRRERGYLWDTKWPENYWLVNYQFRENDRRRVTVRFVDQDNYIHFFYAIPWAD